MERFVKKYFEMLGLQYSNVTSIDDYVGIIFRNNCNIGLSKKVGNVVVSELDDINISNKYLYKSILFKKLNDDSVEGTLYLKSENDDKKIYYTMNEKDKTCTLEEEDKIQVIFTPSYITTLIEDKRYKSGISNIVGYSEIDREKITEVLFHLYEIVPDLIINILSKYDLKYSDYIYKLTSKFQEKEKTKQLIF